MSEKIEGVPEGYELVRIGQPERHKDVVIDCDGRPVLFDNTVTQWVKNWPIVRKVKKPKKSRPFENGSEFEPHRERWVVWKSNGDTTKIGAYNDKTLWFVSSDFGLDYEQAFERLTFEDGSVFGIEVPQ